MSVPGRRTRNITTVVIVSILLMMLSFLCLLYRDKLLILLKLREPSSGLSFPHEYAVCIDETGIRVHLKCRGDANFIVNPVEVTLDQAGDYFISVSAHDIGTKWRYQAYVSHYAETFIRDIVPGSHRIVIKSGDMFMLLTTFTWPSNETQYILTKDTHPYESALDLYKRINEINGTNYILTDESFYQQYWVEQKTPVPDIENE